MDYARKDWANVKRNRYVPGLIISFFCIIVVSGQSHAGELRPNIIYILADDLGYGDLSCFNVQSKIVTPNIDWLASGGMRFTDAHAAASVCTPSRYSLLTGRYAFRSPLKAGVLWSYDWPLITAQTPTVAEFLKNYGYNTALFGKWHLGWRWPLKNGETIDTAAFGGRDQEASLIRENKVDLTKPLEGGPLSCGFDYYFGIDIPSLPPFCFIENNKVYGKIPDKLKPGNMSGLKGLMQDGWTSQNMLPTIMWKAIDYITAQSSSNTTSPYFLFLSLTAPHTPIAPSPGYKGKSKAGDYGDFVYEIDDYVGRVLKAVEASGKENNTLIIFASDNGPIMAAGDPFLSETGMANYGSLGYYFKHNSSADFRGMKGDAWEAGHRIPFIARWPGVIPAGKVNDAVISLTDLFKTCAGILNVAVDDSIAVDSYNIFPLLKDDKVNGYACRYIITQSSKGCLSMQNKTWKFINCNNSGGNLYNYYGKDTVTYSTPGQLYNMKRDPSETKNLYKKKPAVVKKLIRRLGTEVEGK